MFNYVDLRNVPLALLESIARNVKIDESMTGAQIAAIVQKETERQSKRGPISRNPLQDVPLDHLVLLFEQARRLKHFEKGVIRALQNIDPRKMRGVVDSVVSHPSMKKADQVALRAILGALNRSFEERERIIQTSKQLGKVKIGERAEIMEALSKISKDEIKERCEVYLELFAQSSLEPFESIQEILEVLNEIPFDHLSKVVKLLLQSGCMVDFSERSTVVYLLRALTKVPADEIEERCSQYLTILSKLYYADNFSEIFKSLNEVPSEHLKRFIHELRRFFRSCPQGYEKVEICRLLAKASPAHLKQLVDQSLDLIKSDSKHPAGSKRREIPIIVRALSIAQPEDYAAIVTQSERLFTPSMSPINRARIVRILSEFPEKEEEIVSSILGFSENEIDKARIIEDLFIMEPLKEKVLLALTIVRSVPSDYRNGVFEAVRLMRQDDIELANRIFSLTIDPIVVTGLYLAYRYFKSKRLHMGGHLLAESPVSPPHPPLSDLPEDLAWRLMVPREFHDQGPLVFDRDKSPGYLNGMRRVFRFIQAVENCRMNAFLLLMMHDIAVLGGQFRMEAMRIGYAQHAWSYWMDWDKIAEDAKQELYKEWEEQGLILSHAKFMEIKGEIDSMFPESSEEDKASMLHKRCAHYLAIQGEPRMIRGEMCCEIKSQFRPGRDEGKIDRILNQFYDDVERAQTMDEKYAAVVTCIRALQVFHTFPDGNGRTITFALLTLLLYKIGSPPAIAYKNLFEGNRTTTQMVGEIKKRVQEFQSLGQKVKAAEIAGKIPADLDAVEQYKELQAFYDWMDKQKLANSEIATHVAL